jgi:hypothetical protein
LTIPILTPARVDDLARALLTVTRELTVLADRVHVLEALLERAGVATIDQVERFEPDDCFRAEADRRREAIVRPVFAALKVPLE